MHFLLGIAIVAGGVWLAIEYPNFRKALLITGIGLALLVMWTVWLVTKHPG